MITERIHPITGRLINLERFESLTNQLRLVVHQPIEDRGGVGLVEFRSAIHEFQMIGRRALANRRDRGIGIDLVVERVDAVHAHERYEVTIRAHARSQQRAVFVLQPSVGADEA